MNLSQLKALFAGARCIKLYAKPLAENDNSKNQIYFGPDFQALNLFPTEEIQPNGRSGKPNFKAKINFRWLQSSGEAAVAPHAQFILYPQYPEVRFSGFLKDCSAPPSALMVGRTKGRILFLGVTASRQVLGFVVAAGSEIAAEFNSKPRPPTIGVFVELDLPRVPSDTASRIKLLAELRRVNRLGWIDSKQLAADGNFNPCNAPQCGGFTLEAELGIPKNSAAEPDFLGWEVKQHGVTNFDRIEVGTITLMTPEPTGGFYKEKGPEAFVRKFGYVDKRGRIDRWNFGGVHRFDKRHSETHLTMTMTGYDVDESRITDPGGAIVLLTDKGFVAASWGFSSLLKHWTKKHAKAAYVPSQCRKKPRRQYRYGPKVRLATHTDFLRFVKAMADGAVYYDPGIKLENASTTPRVKRRSQFRIASKNIPLLYESVEGETL